MEKNDKVEGNLTFYGTQWRKKVYTKLILKVQIKMERKLKVTKIKTIEVRRLPIASHADA